MIKAEHVITIHHLIGKGILVVKVIRFCVGGTLNDSKLNLFELLSFDTCSFRDSFFGVFEDFALCHIELVTVGEIIWINKKKTYRLDQENEWNTMRLCDILIKVKSCT